MATATIGIDNQIHFEFDNRGLLVTVTADGMKATKGIYVDPDHGFFPSEFFDQIYKNWQGWDDKLTWRSLEGDLQLCATHNGLGTIEIEATLKSDRGTHEEPWSASCIVRIKAGEELKSIADTQRQLFYG